MNLEQKIMRTITTKIKYDGGNILIDNPTEVCDEIIRQIKNYAKVHGWSKREMLCRDYENGKCVDKSCHCDFSPDGVCCIDCKKYGECEVACIYVDFTQTELTKEDFE